MTPRAPKRYLSRHLYIRRYCNLKYYIRPLSREQAAACKLFSLYGLIACLLCTQTAWAGPWTQEKSTAYLNTTLLYQTIEGQTAWRGEVYSEYGLTPDWTGIAKIDGLKFADLSGFDQYGYQIGLRRALWQKGRWQSAIELSYIYGPNVIGIEQGCASPGGLIRFSFGANGQNKKGRDWYLFTDTALQQHKGCFRQRLEAGYGREIRENWTSITKFYLDFGTGYARSIKTETLLSHRHGKTHIHIGVRQELGGNFEEFGLIMGLERRF